jgi:glycosyltransferase involved in cell wall biosynthesis
MRILYVHSTLVPPPADPRRDRFFLLSEEMEGDVLQPIWFETPAEVEATFGPGSYPVYARGRFRYHWLLSDGLGSKRLRTLWACLRQGFRLHRERRFDCIVAYSHQTTGVLAAVLKLLTGAKLIVEIVTSPHLVYITHSARPNLRDRIMKIYSDICLHISVSLSDRVHCLFPDQLSHYPLLRKVGNSVFHDFVPVSAIGRAAHKENGDVYVLLVGAPWYLKGIDVLIRAFLLLAPDFPQVKLRILGHFPGQEEFRKLAAESPQIEFLRARPNPETLEIIAGAAVMALPSRCEGGPRVLIEGMAAGLPLVGSDVGGIPSIVRDGENGFIVPVGDWQALSARLRDLLNDPDLRRRMGDCGYEIAHRELDEASYVRNFTRMIRATLGVAERE